MRVLVACEYSGRVRDAFIKAGHHAISCDLLETDSPGVHYKGDCLDLLDGWEPVQFTVDCDPEGSGECETIEDLPDNCDCIGPTEEGAEYKYTKDGVLLGRRFSHPKWDLMIAHPPCTYLSCSAEWAYGDGPYHQKVKPGTLVGEERRQARQEAIDFVNALMNARIDKIAIENPVGVLSKAIRDPDQYIQPYEYGDDASKKTCLWLKNLPTLVPTELCPPRLAKASNGKSYSFRWGNQTDSGQNKEPPREDRWKIRSVTWQGWADAMASQWG